MKSTLVTAPVRQDHPPQLDQASSSPRPVRPVGLLDRAALHLGLALITWGRRRERTARRARRFDLSQLDDAGRREVEEANRQREELRDQFLALQLFR